MQRWDPFQDMMSLRDAMSQLFEQSMVRPTTGMGRLGGPPMDVYTEGDQYVIEMAVPGVDPSTIDLSVQGDQLTVCGEFRGREQAQGARQGDGQQHGGSGRQYLLRELPTGHFERSVTLPTELNADKAQAHCDQGILRVTVPKAESARARRIQIGGGQTRQSSQPAMSGSGQQRQSS
jgi:HSP20 family protein